jgi:hypothetical protein
MRWMEDAARIGKQERSTTFFLGKHARERQLGIPRRRCEDNIKMYLREQD